MKGKMDFSEINNVTIVKYHGEMTFFFLSDLDRYLKEKINEKKCRFIFDMSEVTWIDSMGLGLLAMVIKISLLNGTRLCLINPRENVIDVLKLSGLLDLLMVFKSVEEATAFFK